MTAPTTSPETMPDYDPRAALVIRIEWTLLVLRYAALAALLFLDWIAGGTHSLPGVWISIAGVGIHNAFSHWVLHGGRYHLFFSPLNFCIYLVDLTLIVALTGDIHGTFAVLFPLFMIGYCLYSPRFEGLYQVTLVCCFAYLGTFVYRYWRFDGVELEPALLDLLGIFLCGWLISTLGLLLQRIEHLANTQARELASSEATLRTIFDNTAEPVLVCDENEMIVDLNHQACEFLRVQREVILGRRFRHLLFDDGTLPSKMTTLRTQGEFRGEVIAVLNTGEERDADLLARSFIRNKRRYFVLMVHDITGHKSLQEASRLANQRLAEANAELQRISTMRSEFVARTSKHLRSPLAALIGYMDLLLDEALGELTPEQRKAVHSSRRTALRVLDLIDQAFKGEEYDSPSTEGRADGEESLQLDSSHSTR